MSIARLRLITGVILFLYVLGHFLNHAMGIYSVEFSLLGQTYFTAPWKTPVGLVLLIGSGVTHMVLAMVSLARRRSFRMTKIEILQYLSGLAIPIIMADHVSLALLSHLFNGTTINFFGMNLFHWVIHPTSSVTTVGAIIVVWVHACIGIHFNLKVKPFYERWSSTLLVLAVMVPLLSIAGHISGGMASLRRIPDPDQANMILSIGGITEETWVWVHQREAMLTYTILGIIGAVLAFRIVRHLLAKVGPSIKIVGNRTIKVIPGATVLEILRDHDVPHASICGGRGRCTTCRVKVTEGLESLPKQSGDEAAALKEIEADDDVRLACQIRPTQDISIMPLLPVGVTMRQGRQKAHLAGFEQKVACMFIDMRGSTALAEKRLPYDVLFFLNQFFTEMSAALDLHEGHYAQFTGDGLMALFGLEGTPEVACRNAWKCACDMFERVDNLNAKLEHDLPFPLKIGVGIHFGVAIVGDIGPPLVRQVSAIGDTINTAARLEAMCKTLSVPLVVSEVAVKMAGISPPLEMRHEVEVRGRAQTLPVFALDEKTSHKLLIDIE